MLKASFCNENGEAMAPVEKNFVDHLAQHGKSFPTKEEYNFRLETFKAKDEKINASNANPKNTFKLAHNHMSTMTKEEYAKLLSKQKITSRRLAKGTPTTRKLQASPTGPFDWRDPAGDASRPSAVSSVKDITGGDESLTTLAELAAIESAAYLAGYDIDPAYTLVDLSDQQCIDCASDSDSDAEIIEDEFGNVLPPPFSIGHCFEYAETHYIQTAAVYENNENFDGKQCKVHDQADKGRGKRDQINLTTNPGHVKVTAINEVTAQSVDDLKVAIETTPVVVAVQASSDVFQSYTSGVFNDALCGTTVDHTLLAVGWGNDGTNDYYIAKNSFGESWGESGYIRIATEDSTDGICGIQSNAIWATVEFEAGSEPQPPAPIVPV